MNPFEDRKVLRLARRLSKESICLNCFGRMFAKVSTGLTNRKRGEILSSALKLKPSKTCSVCGLLFDRLPSFSEIASKKLQKIEYSTFLVGTGLTG